MTQAEVDAVFTNWLSQVNYSGGCNAVLSRSPITPNAPSRCGGSIEVTWTVKSSCVTDVVKKATFTVPTNVAPAINSVSANSVEPMALGAITTMNINFSDLNANTVVVDWGDLTVENFTGIFIGTSSLSKTHKYTDTGVYSVKVTVTDVCGFAAEYIYKYVVIYDPNGGFITGGGWINSPLNAFKANLSLTGKANFGFVAKYKKGSTVPDGNTEFQFQAGNLNFNSSSYDDMRLVISGAKANYKGKGTIKGSTLKYAFLVSAIDGDVNGGGGVDKFRIKIWVDGSPSNIIYDNNISGDDNADPASSLGGGSIVIHSDNKKAAFITPEIAPVVVVEPTIKAYPNPFTERLNIEFSSANDTQATLEMYSITGAKLTTLFDAPVNGGDLYKVEYVPNLVSSQMVFYHLTMNGKTQVGKVIYNERR